MKNAWINTWIFAFLAAAVANGAEKHNPDLIVYVHHGSETALVMGPAENQAEHMLASAGISMAWRLGDPRISGRSEVIEVALVDQPNENFKPGALAFARLGPKTGTRIEIFMNRVRASGPPALLPNILAHVMVHEITHVLEGVARHSASGVMKAHWTPDDFFRMRAALPFAAEDLELIHAWAARHSQTVIAAR